MKKEKIFHPFVCFLWSERRWLRKKKGNEEISKAGNTIIERLGEIGSILLAYASLVPEHS